MKISDYKDPIIVGVLFLLFTREWFDKLIIDTFPILKDTPMVYLVIKVLLIMILFWGLNKITVQ